MRNDHCFTEEQLIQRREILEAILGDDFLRLYAYYKAIAASGYDLYVFLCRKAWCMFQLFLPLLEADGANVDRARYTHDRMLAVWFAEQKKAGRAANTLRIFVEDDTYLSGRGLDKCLIRLVYAHGVSPKNITMQVFAIASKEDDHLNFQRIENNRYTVFIPPELMEKNPDACDFAVQWEKPGLDALYPDGVRVSKISNLSEKFVEAFHACSQPYIGYYPAFSIPLDKASRVFFGANAEAALAKIRSDYLEASDFAAPYGDKKAYEYSNITIAQQVKHGVEAFFFQPRGEQSDCLPPSQVRMVTALRFYMNTKTERVIMVPYISLNACDDTAELEPCFPDELKHLVKDDNTGTWLEREGALAAHRLLRYAASYLWGKEVLTKHFQLSGEETALVSRGGILSDSFWTWLDNDAKMRRDLKRAWARYPAPSTEDMRDWKRFVHADYHETIDENLDSAKGVVKDYFCTASLLFREIMDKELMLLQKRRTFPRSPAFSGFPLVSFFALFKDKFHKLKEKASVLPTVSFMLCDAGEAVTQVSQVHGRFDTVLSNGEQSCHALLQAVPEYARFLSELPALLKGKEARVQELRHAVETFFEDTDETHQYRLAGASLMRPFTKMQERILSGDKERFAEYSAMEEGDYFDSTKVFFDALRIRLRDGLPLDGDLTPEGNKH